MIILGIWWQSSEGGGGGPGVDQAGVSGQNSPVPCSHRLPLRWLEIGDVVFNAGAKLPPYPDGIADTGKSGCVVFVFFLFVEKKERCDACEPRSC